MIVDKVLTWCLAFSSCLMNNRDRSLITKPLLLAVSKARVPRRERKDPKGWLGAGGYWVEAGPQQCCFPRTSGPSFRTLSLSCSGWPFRVSYFCWGLPQNGKAVLYFYFWAVHCPFRHDFEELLLLVMRLKDILRVLPFLLVNTREKLLHENQILCFLEWMTRLHYRFLSK